MSYYSTLSRDEAGKSRVAAWICTAASIPLFQKTDNIEKENEVPSMCAMY